MAGKAMSILGPCLGLALALPFVAGCSSEDPGVSVLSEPFEPSVPEHVQGTLGIDAGGCVRIGDDYAVWPRGTKRTQDGVEVGDRLLPYGTEISGSGGFLAQEFAGQFMGLDDAYEMARCTDPEDRVAVLNLLS